MKDRRLHRRREALRYKDEQQIPHTVRKTANGFGMTRKEGVIPPFAKAAPVEGTGMNSGWGTRPVTSGEWLVTRERAGRKSKLEKRKATTSRPLLGSSETA